MPGGNEDFGSGAAPVRGLTFEIWRRSFFADAQHRGLLYNAQSIGDYTLQLFWERGVSPTVDAVIASGQNEPFHGQPTPKRAQ